MREQETRGGMVRKATLGKRKSEWTVNMKVKEWDMWLRNLKEDGNK